MALHRLLHVLRHLIISSITCELSIIRLSPLLVPAFIAIDEIAERIRALGAYAIGGLATHAAAAQMKEFVSPLPQENYVSALLAANENLVKDAAGARDLAGEVNDPETQDLMTARITLHQKTIWMLRSFLK